MEIMQVKKEEKEMVFIYLLLGYWAAGRTVYKNKILIGSFNAIFLRKFAVGFFFGWILIPIAILGLIFGRR